LNFDVKEKKGMIVSVIIPCYNGRETIRMTLESLRKQTAVFQYEVIVVDSSSDRTDQLIRDEFPEVRLIHLDAQTLPGSGRNLGILNARGEIVAFTDADAVPDPDWLDRIVSVLKSRKTDAAGGAVINGFTASMAAWISHLVEFNEWTVTTPAGYVKNIPSVNIAFRKNTFSRYRICYSDIFPSEDTLMNWSLIERGGNLYFDPSIRVTHWSRSSLSRLFSHQIRLGRASGHARRISTLPGRFFVRHPWFCVLIPAVRWARACARILKKDPKLFFLFLGLTPFILLATAAWAIGFIQQTHYPDPRFIIDGCDFKVFGKARRNS
jgi:glycosyltransferase involved in cell wall biosynthesis